MRPVLSVASDRLRRWYRPGLLLIGDAAHVMSPVAGLGINYAIQDAVVAANLLTTPLLAGRVEPADLAAIQRQREWPTRVAQAVQSATQHQEVDEFPRGRPASPAHGSRAASSAGCRFFAMSRHA